MAKCHTALSASSGLSGVPSPLITLSQHRPDPHSRREAVLSVRLPCWARGSLTVETLLRPRHVRGSEPRRTLAGVFGTGRPPARTRSARTWSPRRAGQRRCLRGLRGVGVYSPPGARQAPRGDNSNGVTIAPSLPGGVGAAVAGNLRQQLRPQVPSDGAAGMSGDPCGRAGTVGHRPHPSLTGRPSKSFSPSPAPALASRGSALLSSGVPRGTERGGGLEGGPGGRRE